jgi:hypothetical protein
MVGGTGASYFCIVWLIKGTKTVMLHSGVKSCGTLEMASTKREGRILVVDDEPNLNLCCQFALEYASFKVDAFGSRY